MILADYSQLGIAGCFAFSADFQKGQDTGKMLDIIRHSFLMSMLSYKQKYGKKYGEIVIACDGSDNWRKKVYPYYKQHRKAAREEATMDWNTVFKHLDALRADLETVFPWKVIRHDRAEGDDVISTLVDYVVENHTVQDGLFEISEPILILSSDGDFKQLHEKGDIKQWNPLHKKWVSKPDKDFLIDKIIRGDGGDGIPSVLSPDDFYVDPNSGRAKPVTAKVVERFSKGVGLTEEEKRRFERNRQLISFDYIPDDIRSEIVEQYLTATPNKDLNTIMEYLMSKRARQLLERVHEFKR